MAAQTSSITARTCDQTSQAASYFETEPNNSPDSNRDIKPLRIKKEALVETSEAVQVALVIYEIQKTLESQLMNFYNAYAFEKFCLERYKLSVKKYPNSEHSKQSYMNYIKAHRRTSYYWAEIDSSNELLDKIMRLAIEIKFLPTLFLFKNINQFFVFIILLEVFAREKIAYSPMDIETKQI